MTQEQDTMPRVHTAMPWRVVPDTYDVSKGEGYAIADGDGRHYLGWGMSRATAEFIVRCVNAHDELVAALTDIRTALDALYSVKNDAGLFHLPDDLHKYAGPIGIMDRVTDAALKIARGGQS